MHIRARVLMCIPTSSPCRYLVLVLLHHVFYTPEHFRSPTSMFGRVAEVLLQGRGGKAEYIVGEQIPIHCHAATRCPRLETGSLRRLSHSRRVQLPGTHDGVGSYPTVRRDIPSWMLAPLPFPLCASTGPSSCAMREVPK